MTVQPPGPDPYDTSGLARGGGVRLSGTPPESAQTSGVIHREPRQPEWRSVAWVVAIATVVMFVVGFSLAHAVVYINGG